MRIARFITLVLIVILTLLVLLTPVNAATLANVQSPSVSLYTEQSQVGESLDDFAARIAPRIRATTVDINAEVCGSFQRNGDLYRIQFYTNNSVWGCSIGFGGDGEWKATRLTMHTHTEAGGNGFSAQDNVHKLQGYVVSLYTMTKRIGNRERTVSTK